MRLYCSEALRLPGNRPLGLFAISMPRRYGLPDFYTLLFINILSAIKKPVVIHNGPGHSAQSLWVTLLQRIRIGSQGLDHVAGQGTEWIVSFAFDSTKMS